MDEKELLKEYQKKIQKYSHLLKEMMKTKDELLDIEKQLPNEIRNSLKGGYAGKLS